jgi:hypothetical protein
MLTVSEGYSGQGALASRVRNPELDAIPWEFLDTQERT